MCIFVQIKYFLLKKIILFILFFVAPVSQANWCNMTFTAGSLFPPHSCIGGTRVKPPLGFKPRSPA